MHDLADEGEGPLSARRLSREIDISGPQTRNLHAGAAISGEHDLDRGQGLRDRADSGSAAGSLCWNPGTDRDRTRRRQADARLGAVVGYRSRASAYSAAGRLAWGFPKRDLAIS